MNSRSWSAAFAWLLLIASGCSEPKEEVLLDARNLEKGMTLLFLIQETDSTIGPNTREQRQRSEKAVYFTVVDTVDGFTIEWNEQHLLDRLDSTDANGAVQEWVSYCRIVYHSDELGAIDKVLNYEEIRSSIDPLIEHYIEQVGLADDPRVKEAMPALLDSAWVISRLLANAELLHRLYGTSLSATDTTRLLSFTPSTDPAMAEYFMILDRSPLCQNAIGVKGWSTTVTVDLNDHLSSMFNDDKAARSLSIPSAQASERMVACFDQQRGLAIYLDFERRMQMDTATLVQRVLIYERE